MRRIVERMNEDRERGAALVEFALVLPILLVILLGIVDFGLYFYNDLQLTHAARDAARYLTVGGPDATAKANAAIDDAAGRLTDNTDPPTRNLLPGSSGNPATVGLTTTYHCITPLPNLVPGIEDGQISIDASAVMRVE